MNMLEEQVAMEGHSDLTSAGASKEEADQTMAEFMANIQEHEPDWKEDIAGDESDKDVKVSDEDGQFEVSSDEEFEEEDEEEE